MKLELNEFEARIHGGVKYDVIPEVYPGTMTLKAVPWRGKLRRWWEGVSRPVTHEPSRHLTRAEFNAQKHYRLAEGTMSTTGDPALLGIVPDESQRITDPVELDTLYRNKVLDERTIKVDPVNCEVHFHPSLRDHERDMENGKQASGLYLSYDFCWQPEPATETETSITVRFKPTLLAQLRHFFTLKPWTYTLHAAPAA